MKTLKSIVRGLRLAWRLGELVCVVSFVFSVHKTGARPQFYHASVQEVAGPPGTQIEMPAVGG